MNTLFDGRAGDYAAGRPGYAPALIDCLYNRYGLSAASVIADIGSGTGKFAAQLLERGSTVYCVEPNEDMRSAAAEILDGYPNFHPVNGDAENTCLDDGCAEYITSAQAFHWFDGEKFARECARILKKDGSVILVWNVRDMGDSLNRELYDIYRRYCPRFVGFSGGIEKDDIRIKNFFGGVYDHVSFDHPLVYDRERFVSRSLSGSYSLKSGDRDYDEYIAALTEVFAKYENNGTVVMANRSDAYIGRPAMI